MSRKVNIVGPTDAWFEKPSPNEHGEYVERKESEERIASFREPNNVTQLLEFKENNKQPHSGSTNLAFGSHTIEFGVPLPSDTVNADAPSFNEFFDGLGEATDASPPAETAESVATPYVVSSVTKNTYDKLMGKKYCDETSSRSRQTSDIRQQRVERIEEPMDDTPIPVRKSKMPEEEVVAEQNIRPSQVQAMYEEMWFVLNERLRRNALPTLVAIDEKLKKWTDLTMEDSLSFSMCGSIYKTDDFFKTWHACLDVIENQKPEAVPTKSDESVNNLKSEIRDMQFKLSSANSEIKALRHAMNSKTDTFYDNRIHDAEKQRIKQELLDEKKKNKILHNSKKKFEDEIAQLRNVLARAAEQEEKQKTKAAGALQNIRKISASESSSLTSRPLGKPTVQGVVELVTEFDKRASKTAIEIQKLQRENMLLNRRLEDASDNMFRAGTKAANFGGTTTDGPAVPLWYHDTVQSKLSRLLPELEEMKARLGATDSIEKQNREFKITIAELERTISEMRVALHMTKTSSSASSTPELMELLRLLSVDTPKQVVDSVRNMTEAVRKIPSMTNFMKRTCALTAVKEGDLHGVVSKIELWRHSLQLLDDYEGLREELFITWQRHVRGAGTYQPLKAGFEVPTHGSGDLKMLRALDGELKRR